MRKSIVLWAWSVFQIPLLGHRQDAICLNLLRLQTCVSILVRWSRISSVRLLLTKKRRLRMFGHIPCIPTPDGPHWRSNSNDFKYQPSSWWDIVQCHRADHYCFRLSGTAVSCKDRNINIWHGECLRHLDNIRRLWLERCQRRLIKYIATLYRRMLSIDLHLTVVDQPTMSV